MGFELVTLESGAHTLRSLENGETFHPVVGPRNEARLLHITQCRLAERCRDLQPFVIWDVGLGAAANALAAIEAVLESSSDREMELHSFDLTASPLEFALGCSDRLDYLSGKETLLSELLAHSFVEIESRIRWKLHLGDFTQEVNDPRLPAPHAVLYDPYSPAENPEMWTLGHFSALARRMAPSTPCLLTSYTRSTAIRVALLLAGLYVGAGRAVGEKEETTVASNSLSLVESPLGREWLERVRKSGGAAPLRTAVYSQSKISDSDFEALQKLPQFASQSVDIK